MAKNTARRNAAAPTRPVKAATRDQPLIQERRDRLINAAIKVFKEKGFHAATTRDIGRVAGMTQGTIYNYVSSKDDILYLVCDRLVAEYQEETRKALESVPDPVERVRSAARAVAEIMYHHQEEILLIYQNSYLLDHRSLHVILARVEGFVQMFDKLLTDAAREAGIPLSNSYLAAHIFTFVPTMIALRRWGVGRIGPEQTISGIADFLARGMGFVLPPGRTTSASGTPPK